MQALKKLRAKPSATFIVGEGYLQVAAKAAQMWIVAMESGTDMKDGPFYSLQPSIQKKDKAAITRDIKRRMALNVTSCEVDIEDLLFAAGPIKAVRRSNPRWINVTVEELQAEEIMATIKAFVGSSGDSVA
jgi:hypothetical protein